MNWLHDDIWRQGTAKVAGRELDKEWAWRIGTVATGKQRVFYGYFIEMSDAMGHTFRGEDRHCIRDALNGLGSQMADHRLIPVVAGLSALWQESGLSFNTGFGWWSEHPKPIGIMDAPPD